jgi:periplasmic divalent cation tolerance protein
MFKDERMIFVYITNPSKKEAERIALHLLKKRLIACANIFPVDSRYWWMGTIEKAKEYAILAKTLEKNFGKVKKEVKRIHKYTIPEIAKIEAEANKDYEDWLRKEVR